jgi:hypothetical protein
VPCIAVANPPAEAWEAGKGLVLMMAVDALRLCGRSAVNTARVECWRCDLAEALLAPLTGSQSRPFTAI